MTDNAELLYRNTVLGPTTHAVVFHPQPIVAGGLATILATGNGIEVVATASRTHALLTAVSRLGPHVVVLGMARAGWAHADRLMCRVSAAAADRKPAFVVVVSGDQDAADALAVDATAVVTTEVSGHALRDLVLGADDTKSRHVPADLVRPRMTTWPHNADPAGTGLTIREREVLRDIEKGLSTKQIAAHLGISVNTARTHAQRLLAKLRVHSRLQAAALAACQSQLVASGRRT